jgi:glycosyltransferase involved in cell wall biosynthesis
MEISVILLLLTLFFLIIQLIYWIFLARPYFFRQSQEKKETVPESSQPPVSVIIYTKREAQNLETYLPSILEQEYPLYEVIIVNYNLNDDTDDVLKRLSFKYKHLYHTYLPEGSKILSRKKLGLTVGIKAAQYDALLFTETDCHPVDSAWISRMARNFTDKKTIVLGFSALEKPPSLYIAYDYFFSNLQMMSLAVMKHPYAGNGRNLGYSKNYFMQQKGFSRSNFLDAGEDDLFINEIARKENVAVELSPESVVRVNMDESRTWRELKRRRMLTQKFYKKFPVYFWRMEKWSRILFFTGWILTIIWVIADWIFLGITLFFFLVRLFTQLFVINKTAETLKLPKFYFTLPLFDFIQFFVDEYFYLYRKFGGRKDYNW